ncbi:hypothetical protein [Terrimonas alba]|uniref:hypothetical protein n=1 Tax=Terrimonas alba TaxID=3349636 RepID=UPI0035F2AC58
MEYTTSTSLIKELSQGGQPNTDSYSGDKVYGMKLLYEIMQIRRFEEKSAELYTKEKIRGFLHLYVEN